MPQMSPMNWILISTFFMLIWMLIKVSLNFFSLKILSKKILINLMTFTW